MTGKRPRIALMLRHVDERGGISVFTRRIVEHLARNADEFDFHMLYRSAAQRSMLGHLPGEHVVVPAPNKLVWDQIAVPRYARRSGASLVFNGKLSVPLVSPAPTVFTMPSGAQFAVPWVYPPADRLYTRMMVPRYCRSARAVVTHTEQGRRDIVKLSGIDPGRVHVIPHGVSSWLRPASIETRAAFLESRGLDRPYVLFVGGITPLKNIGGLLRAFANLRAHADVELVLAGFKRWRFASDIALIEQLRIGDHVRLLGFVPDEELAALYSAAACFVMPSWYEGFGIPIIEAMACGCPVVTSNAGCLPEVAGGAALLVEPSDHSAMATSILRLIENPEARAEYIERGLRRAAPFTWEATGEGVRAVFRGLLFGESARPSTLQSAGAPAPDAGRAVAHR